MGARPLRFWGNRPCSLPQSSCQSNTPSNAFTLSLPCLPALLQNFHCGSGAAYLFERAVNVIAGEPEDRSLITGLHTVCDLFCTSCNTLVGWRYEVRTPCCVSLLPVSFPLPFCTARCEATDGICTPTCASQHAYAESEKYKEVIHHTCASHHPCPCPS